MPHHPFLFKGKINANSRSSNDPPATGVALRSMAMGAGVAGVTTLTSGEQSPEKWKAIKLICKCKKMYQNAMVPLSSLATDFFT